MALLHDSVAVTPQWVYIWGRLAREDQFAVPIAQTIRTKFVLI
jgi:hypothetical protein